MKYIFYLVPFLVTLSTFANPRVPTNYEFAGIKLVINESARKQIQLDVDALHRNQSYLRKRIETIDIYFPIIERVFREENLPDDFKYLSIQESALIPDAVSSSNAVGFWQFKEASAREVGLTVNRYIDERMHITASTHAAAKYLKKNNFFFDNWIYALLAYNTGPTGAEKYVEKKYIGKKKMDITGRTHWYVKKFLAYKIAFENEIHKNYTHTLKIFEYENSKGRSLKYLSDYFDIDYQTLAEFNKWMKTSKMPVGESNIVIIPVSRNDLVAQKILGVKVKSTNSIAKKEPTTNPSQKAEKEEDPMKIAVHKPKEHHENVDLAAMLKFPVISSTRSNGTKINGIPGFIATRSDNVNSISKKFGIDKGKFLKYNDMTPYDKIIEGQVYYLKSKNSKAKTHYHIVYPGESIWSISQKYGVKTKKLLTKNRFREEKELKPGMVLWLRFIRPAEIPIEHREIDVKPEAVQQESNLITHLNTNKVKINSEETSGSDTDEHAHDGDAPEEEILFEEVNDGTNFINENSYVNLKDDHVNEEVNIDEVEVSDESPLELGEENIKKAQISHIVKSGETLFSLSRTYMVSIGQLRQWNDIDDLDILHVGQRVIIKKEGNEKIGEDSYSSVQYKTHKVKKEETLYGIARQYDVTIKDLMDLNDKEDFTVNEGEELKIKALE